MEKFTVDLDRVLDEFEFNEDCAEQTARGDKKTCESFSSDNASCHTQDGVPMIPFNLYQVDGAREMNMESTAVTVMQLDSSFLNTKFGDGGLPCEVKFKGFVDRNSRHCSTKLANANTSSKVDENKSSLHCKLNVSGVFSSLNEYINTGSLAIRVERNEINHKEINPNEELWVSRKCEMSPRVMKGCEFIACEARSETNCDLLSAGIENFHQISDLQLASSFTEGCLTGNNLTNIEEMQYKNVNRMDVFDLSTGSSEASTRDGKEMDMCQENKSVENIAKQHIADVTVFSCLNNVSSNTNVEPLLQNSGEEPDQCCMNLSDVTAEFDSVCRNASVEAKEEATWSSPESSETSSIEVSVHQYQSSDTNNTSDEAGCLLEEQKVGKCPPLWISDDKAPSCMLCFSRFTVLKRRHHCRACGKVFCSKCCCLKYRLEYLNNTEVRVCQLCHDILVRAGEEQSTEKTSDSSTGVSRSTPVGRHPNPNNPMEYCSTVPPLEQAASALSQPLPSVLVPVGVLKREGGTRLKSDVAKQVMFSDGIRPGGDLTESDTSSEQQVSTIIDVPLKRTSSLSGTPYSAARSSRSFNPKKSFIPNDGIPPLAVMEKGQLTLEAVSYGEMSEFLSSLRCETNTPSVFALNQNLFVQLKILNLDCCVNRTCWCFSTIGMSCVGQDEIVIVLECLPTDISLPKDIFNFLNNVYIDASRGILVTEMGHTVLKNSTFLGSADHGGFLYIRPSFQCLHKIILPSAPYLVGILIHRWEIPWAKLFPIRLMLRLGAEFRYYPCMLVSVQQREPVYCEIGHTIMNLLADFRNMSYTLPPVRGMVIHMEDRYTSILLPKNRYDQVARALNNSNDHVLALAATFSLEADSHLVCIQSPTDDSYHTQAINIHNKPRKVTGASFVVFNGALKMSSNLMAKSTIVEDGLMVQITPDTIQELRNSLHKMKDFVVHCGPTSASEPDEVVEIRWVEDDHNFNVGVQSVIDGMALDGVQSIRVHNGSDFLGKTRFIRWTEVFILQPGNITDGLIGTNDTLDVSRVAETLAAAVCMALCDFLDLLAQGGFTTIAVRTNIHHDNVGYAVGSRGEKLPPIYMNTLDGTLVPVLHHTASAISNNSPVVLELLFHIMLR